MTLGLNIDTIRGNQGTGLAGIALRGDKIEYQIAKKALAGPDFLQTDVFNKFEKNYSRYNLFIGHNRAPTAGSVIDRNAHPFHIGPHNCKEAKDEIILVHNGTLRNYKNLNATDSVGISPFSFNHDVDSAHAAAGMACFGEQETLDKTQGWFVFVWANLTKKTFNIARSDCRDLAYILSKDKKSIYFGSEHGMIDWLLSRESIQVEDKFRTPNEYEWLSWDMPNDDFSLFRRNAIKKYQPPVAWATGHTTVHHGQTTTTRHRSNDMWDIKTETDKLKALGFDRHEEVYFKVLRYEPYHVSNLNRGIVWGETWDEKPVAVKIAGVTKKDYDQVLSHEYLKDYCIGRCVRVDTQTPETKNVVLELDYVELRSEIIKNMTGREQVSPGGIVIPPDIKSSVGRAIYRQLISRNNETQDQEETTATPRIEVPGPNNDMISLDQWKIFTQDGCPSCNSPIEERDFKDIYWGGEYLNQPYCHEHSKEEFNRRKALLPVTRTADPPLTEEMLERMANGWSGGS